MLTIRIFYKDGSETIIEVLSLDDICLDNVLEFKIVRDERRVA